jgi:hypothetical protein
MAAARQADVGTADPQPAIPLRSDQHLVEKLLVGGLDRSTLGERPLGLGDPRRERVADLLELTEPEQPRWSRGADPVWDDDPAEPLGDEARELPLELADLAP